jgi:dephospho-CoA kinase
MSVRPGTAMVVGVTGGIASGKSALTAAFEALGVPVADADLAARVVVEPGTEGLAAIVRHFGDAVLDGERRLDRRAMRERVFADPAARHALEAIVHPRVRTWLREAVAQWNAPYGLLSVPLLAENAASYAWVDRVLVVDVPEAVQVQRLMTRDGIDRALAESMLAAQATRAQRLAIADDVHDATAPLADLPGRVAGYHARYLELAALCLQGGLPAPRIRAFAAS